MINIFVYQKVIITSDGIRIQIFITQNSRTKWIIGVNIIFKSAHTNIDIVVHL